VHSCPHGNPINDATEAGKGTIEIEGMIVVVGLREADEVEVGIGIEMMNGGGTHVRVVHQDQPRGNGEQVLSNYISQFDAS
jgi:hypothetical protein